MEVNVNGNVTLTIQPSDSLIALFGGLMGSGAPLPKPTETAKSITSSKKNTVKIEEKTAETPTPVDATPVLTQEIPTTVTATEAPDEKVRKYTLEEVKSITAGYLGTNDGTPAFNERREKVKALNAEFGGAMSTIFDKCTPVRIAEYVDRVKVLS